MAGGDMLNLLIQKDTFPEQMARFYVAEMILAIEEVRA
jgi:protein-serine/threonine kinase